MSPLLAELAPPRAASTGPQPPASAAAPTARAVLAGYAWTLLVPLIGLIALLTGWTLMPVGGWSAAVAAVAACAAGSAAWLYRRAWSPALVHLATWAAPAVVLAPLAGLGWLTADGLVLWAPVTSLLAVGLALTHQPLRVATRRPRRG